MTRTASSVLAAILLTALTGCVPAASTSGQAASEPTVGSTPPPPAIIAKPALALGGDCAALIDVASLTELVGDDVVPAEGDRGERVLAVSVLGGLDCSWLSDSEAYVWLDLIPADGLEASLSKAEADSPYCYGGELIESRCTFSALLNGHWLSGIVGVSRESDNNAVDAIEAITARVADAVSAADFVATVRPDGMWSTPADCSDLAEAVDTASILGATFAAEKGNVGGEVTSGFVAALHAVGDMSCIWAASDSDRWFVTELLPGAGWAIRELGSRDGAHPIVVDGALEAVVVPLGGETTAIYATDGVNLVWVTVPADIDEASAAVLTAGVVAVASR